MGKQRQSRHYNGSSVEETATAVFNVATLTTMVASVFYAFKHGRKDLLGRLVLNQREADDLIKVKQLPEQVGRITPPVLGWGSFLQKLLTGKRRNPSDFPEGLELEELRAVTVDEFRRLGIRMRNPSMRVTEEDIEHVANLAGDYEALLPAWKELAKQPLLDGIKQAAREHRSAPEGWRMTARRMVTSSAQEKEDRHQIAAELERLNEAMSQGHFPCYSDLVNFGKMLQNFTGALAYGFPERVNRFIDQYRVASKKTVLVATFEELQGKVGAGTAREVDYRKLLICLDEFKVGLPQELSESLSDILSRTMADIGPRIRGSKATDADYKTLFTCFDIITAAPAFDPGLQLREQSAKYFSKEFRVLQNKVKEGNVKAADYQKFFLFWDKAPFTPDADFQRDLRDFLGECTQGIEYNHDKREVVDSTPLKDALVTGLHMVLRNDVAEFERDVTRHPENLAAHVAVTHPRLMQFKALLPGGILKDYVETHEKVKANYKGHFLINGVRDLRSGTLSPQDFVDTLAPIAKEELLPYHFKKGLRGFLKEKKSTMRMFWGGRVHPDDQPLCNMIEMVLVDDIAALERRLNVSGEVETKTHSASEMKAMADKVEKAFAVFAPFVPNGQQADVAWFITFRDRANQEYHGAFPRALGALHDAVASHEPGIKRGARTQRPLQKELVRFRKAVQHGNLPSAERLEDFSAKIAGHRDTLTAGFIHGVKEFVGLYQHTFFAKMADKFDQGTMQEKDYRELDGWLHALSLGNISPLLEKCYDFTYSVVQLAQHRRLPTQFKEALRSYLLEKKEMIKCNQSGIPQGEMSQKLFALIETVLVDDMAVMKGKAQGTSLHEQHALVNMVEGRINAFGQQFIAHRPIFQGFCGFRDGVRAAVERERVAEAKATVPVVRGALSFVSHVDRLVAGAGEQDASLSSRAQPRDLSESERDY